MKKTFLKRNIWWFIIIAILLVFILNYISKNESLLWDIKHESSIADVNLENVMLFDSKYLPYGFFGNITGFVKFENSVDQPKSMRQYVQIEASNNVDEKGLQIFELTDMLKFSSMPPKKIGEPVELYIDSFTSTDITLVDKGNNNYIFTLGTGMLQGETFITVDKVSILDSTGDKTSLIMDNSAFQKYIKSI